MLYDLDAHYLIVILFSLMIIAVYTGYKFGSKHLDMKSDHSMLLSSLLALLGLLLAFTFGMAGSRYDERRAFMTNESNCIGTAILRADVYPDSINRLFKKDFAKYLNARISYFEAGRDEPKTLTAMKEAAESSNLLWKQASNLSLSKEYYLSSMLMIPALNEMFDSASTINESFNATVPDSIVSLLFIFSIVSAFFIGYNCGVKKIVDKLLVIGFCLLTCIVIYIILDLDRPRRGIISSGTQIHLFRELKGML